MLNSELEARIGFGKGNRFTINEDVCAILSSHAMDFLNKQPNNCGGRKFAGNAQLYDICTAAAAAIAEPLRKFYSPY